MKGITAFGITLAATALVCTPASATVVTFDDITSSNVTSIPDGYAGFDWENFWVLKASEWDPSGYTNGVVSPGYVAFNAYEDPAELSGGPFNLTGVYLTGAWRDDLNIDIEGYRLGSLVYSATVVVDSAAPTWVQLDFLNVDRVSFATYGGTENPDYSGSGARFALDNLVYNTDLVPAPGAVALAGLGAGLAARLRRRRTL